MTKSWCWWQITSPTSEARYQHLISVTNIKFWRIKMLVTDVDTFHVSQITNRSPTSDWNVTNFKKIVWPNLVLFTRFQPSMELFFAFFTHNWRNIRSDVVKWRRSQWGQWLNNKLKGRVISERNFWNKIYRENFIWYCHKKISVHSGPQGVNEALENRKSTENGKWNMVSLYWKYWRWGGLCRLLVLLYPNIVL